MGWIFYLSRAHRLGYSPLMTGIIKAADDATEIMKGTGVGAAGGAVVGALASLFREKPSLKQGLKDAGLGALGGAVAGGGVSMVRNADTDVKSEGMSVGDSATEDAPTQVGGGSKPIDVGEAAVAGLLPFGARKLSERDGHDLGTSGALDIGSLLGLLGGGTVGAYAGHSLPGGASRLPRGPKAKGLAGLTSALGGLVGGSLGSSAGTAEMAATINRINEPSDQHEKSGSRLAIFGA